MIGFFEEQKTNLHNYIKNIYIAFPIVDPALSLNQTQKAHYNQIGQQHPLYGASHQSNSNQEMTPTEVKKSLFQRIFGSKQ